MRSLSFLLVSIAGVVAACGAFGTSDVAPGPTDDAGTDGAVDGTRPDGTTLPDGAPGDVKRIYVAGGTGATGSVSEVVIAEILPNGKLSGWTPLTPMFKPRQYATAVATSKSLFVIGGEEDNATTKTTVASDFIVEGLSGWRQTPHSLATGVEQHGAAATATHVYVAGGRTSGIEGLSNVYRAPINADGQLGAWTTMQSLPDGQGRKRFALAASATKLFAVGGVSAVGGPEACRGEVQVADILPNGDLGGFAKATDIARYDAAVVLHNDYLYVVGGWECGASTRTDVFVAKTTTPSFAFAPTTALPNALYAAAAVAYGKMLYVIGGDSGGPSTLVWAAEIQSDGSLGDWEPMQPLSKGLAKHTAVVR